MAGFRIVSEGTLLRILPALLLAAAPALASGQNDGPLRWPEGCQSPEIRAASHRAITEEGRQPAPFRLALHRCVTLAPDARKPRLHRT